MEQHEIETRRKAIGLSATKLAAYLGKHQQYISLLERSAQQDDPKRRVLNEETDRKIVTASAETLAQIDGVLTRLEQAAKQMPPVLKAPKKRVTTPKQQ
jgi:transcriptional regulator with XRE-family HTH domain